MYKNLRFFSLFLFLFMIFASFSVAADFIWIEGEQPNREPSVKVDESGKALFQLNGAMKPHLLSDGKLLLMQVGGKTAKSAFPDEGLIFGYDFDVKVEGEYCLWARIGFDFSRSPFSWRLDGGEWKTVDKWEPTVDMYELSLWNPIGWLRMDSVNLSAGAHTIEFRHQPFEVENSKGELKPGRNLHMLDAICFSDSDWTPYMKYKPGEDHQTEKDREAGAKIYKMPSVEVGERTELKLDGVWEFARYDEEKPENASRLEGETALDDNFAKLKWVAIDVPGNRDDVLPDFAYAHRYAYRTRVDIPEDMTDRSWQLRLERFVMIASVFVNGEFCDWSRAHSATWVCDVTDAVRPGETNEIVVVMKDCFYGMDPERFKKPEEKALGLRATFYRPRSMFFHQAVGQLLDMPVSWGHGGTCDNGFIEPVYLMASGKVYAEDVFAIPSVTKKELGLELTIHNPGDEAVEVEVKNDVVPAGVEGAKVEKSFAARTLTIEANASKTITLAESWEDPTLWFPDRPFLYNIITTISQGGNVLDTRTTRFGFREWGWDGPVFTCNGVPWQFWEYGEKGKGPDEYAEICKKTGANMLRYSMWANHWIETAPGNISTSDIMDRLDETGIAMRFNSVFDGEVANYAKGLTEEIDGESTWNRALYRNLDEQFKAWVKAYRNHPSLLIWSIDNEVVYVNANLLGQGPQWEPASRLLAEMIMKMDPTRPTMQDGGLALRDPAKWKGVGDDVRALGHMPVSGAHYIERIASLSDYPDAAYTNAHWVREGKNDWPILDDRPLFHGETFYARGMGQAKLAALGGDECFSGLAGTYPARSMFMRMLNEGYRWSRVSAAWDFGLKYTEKDFMISWKPVAMFCRQWDSSFMADSMVKRTLMVHNQSSRERNLTARWWIGEGKEYAKQEKKLTLQPGEQQVFDVEFKTPLVRLDDGRLMTHWNLQLEEKGEQIFLDQRPVSIINPGREKKIAMPDGMKMYVMETDGLIASALQSRGLAFETVDSAEDIPKGKNVALVGNGAVTLDNAADPVWQRKVAGGTRLVVFCQDEPLRFQALPSDLSPTEIEGRMSFPENLSHPVFEGLRMEDFHFWGDDHITWRKAYKKPNRGAVSLVQCHEGLELTALAESKLGQGTMLLNQLAVLDKMDTHPVAARMFDNCIDYAAHYHLPDAKTTAAIDADGPIAKLLTDLELSYERVDDITAGLDNAVDILIVEATAERLAALNAASEDVERFTGKGGDIVVWGVDADEMSAFNQLTGVDQLWRPFTCEAVAFERPRHKLLAGMSMRDLALSSGERAARWIGTEWMADDQFVGVVDYRDIAPFCTINGEPPKSSDTPSKPGPRHAVNGLTSDDYWSYQYYIHMFEGEAAKVVLELPRKETVEALTIRFNTGYTEVKEFELYYDDDDTPAATLEATGDGSVEEFELPAREAKKVTLRVSKYDLVGSREVLGIENLNLWVKRDEAFREKVQPVLDPAGVVYYPRGKGGIVLNQLALPEQERNPANRAKRGVMAKKLLTNLDAVFATKLPPIVGSGLLYSPVAIPGERFNAFRRGEGEPGWFKGPIDLEALPGGDQVFAGVKYHVFDFDTSPVAESMMLAGEGSDVKEKEIAGLKVGRKADALFFLHTWNAGRQLGRFDKEWAEADEKKRKKMTFPTLFIYRIHYADGETADVPVVWQSGTGAWLSDSQPAPLPEAAVAWAAAGDAEQTAALFSMQWNNPRKDVAIESIDILLPEKPDKRLGAPAIIGLTTAVVQE